MHNRIYTAKNTNPNESNLIVSFDKNYILKLCIENAKLYRANSYNNTILITEYANECYIFKYMNGLANYFNNTINNSKDIYNDILKCLDYNDLYFDIDGNYINSEPYPMNPENGSCYWDNYTLDESQCINGKYSSKFNIRVFDDDITKPIDISETITGLKIIHYVFKHAYIDEDTTFVYKTNNISQLIDDIIEIYERCIEYTLEDNDISFIYDVTVLVEISNVINKEINKIICANSIDELKTYKTYDFNK